MKINEVLYEGMEFHACELETRDDGSKLFSPPNMREEELDCHFCDGTGKDDSDYYPDGKCGFCKGSGKVKEWCSDSPEMQVSNSNGYAIQRDILGVEPDYAGSIPPEQLPSIRKKLFKMLNMESERASMHKDQSQSQKQWVSHKGNIATIQKGAQMHDMGRTDSQIQSYARRLLEIVDFAIKNNLYVAWA